MEQRTSENDDDRAFDSTLIRVWNVSFIAADCQGDAIESCARVLPAFPRIVFASCTYMQAQDTMDHGSIKNFARESHEKRDRESNKLAVAEQCQKRMRVAPKPPL